MDGARKIVLNLLTSHRLTACAFFKEAEYTSSCRDTAERDLIEALEAISQYKSAKLASRARSYLADLQTSLKLQLDAGSRRALTATTARVVEQIVQTEAKHTGPNPFLITSKRKLAETDFGSVTQTSALSEEDTSDVSFRPQSSDSEESTVEVNKDNRDYRMEWFVGPGVEESKLRKDAPQWIVGAANVSLLLLEYRQSSVQKARSDTMESAAEVLAISHIFLMEEDASYGVRERFDGELWTSIFKEIKAEYIPVKLSDDDILRCFQMAQTASSNFRDCKALIKKWHRLRDDTTEDVVLEVFDGILLQISLNTKMVDSNEDTFIHKILAPFVMPFFADTELVECVANDELDASYHRKRKFDPSLQGRKPDFAVFTSNQYKKAHLLVVEVKSAKYHATKSKELYDDLVKLGNEMKDVMDKIIDDGVDKDVVVCGLLVEGFRCDLFAMDLRYDAIYRMVRLGRFYLPRDRYDFGVVPTAIQVLLQAKVRVEMFHCLWCLMWYLILAFWQTIVTRSAQLCVESFRIPFNRDTTPPNRGEMTRESFHTPIKIPIKVLK
ncbi:hypothetical protein BC937DRAFT_95471 [Endogone sp. FLAS-F59071]|nr:hypothetical protein BC937DRAFT_95471 [Endogone sp. FLAS-F59071]|eukprot:RUS20333.1 hypothetical protein BC937DRAFT_95471 [Endogone sp. FLAS-F59071]